MADQIADYFHRLRHYDLLTAEQEVELAQEIEAGLFAEHLLADGTSRTGPDVRELRTIVLLGKHAADTLFHANLRLVVSIAKHYTDRGLDYEDLIQEGNLGLLKAVRKNDFTRGFRFSTYATWFIRQSITRALATLDRPVYSLDAEVPDGRGGTETRAEQLLDPSEYEAAEIVFHGQLKAQVRAVLGTLEEPEAGIIAMRFGITGGAGNSLDAVATAFGLTRDRVRQIEAAALKKLKHPSRSDLLRHYHSSVA